MGYTLHGGDGNVWVRASTGLYRTTDAGQTWTKEIAGASGHVAIAVDGTAIVTRVTGGFGAESVAIERHAASTMTVLTIPVSFPPDGRWIGASAEIEGQALFVNVVGRASATVLAPAQLFSSPDRGDTITALAAPPNGADVTSWGMRSCGGLLAVWPVGGTSSASYVRRNGTWEVLVTRPVLAVDCAGSTFVASTLMTAEARVHRVTWDTSGIRSETSIVVPAPLYALTRAPNGSLTGGDFTGTTLYTSTDGGASFVPRPLTAPLTIPAMQNLVRTAGGVWTLTLGFPTWVPDGASQWRLAGLPIGDGLSFGIDVGILGSRRIAAMYVHPLAGGPAGYFLFTSEDAGTTWQFASNPAVAITCMSLSDAGVFLGGAGSDAGVKWAVHDVRGVERLVNNVVKDSGDPTALYEPIIACDWLPAGTDSTVFIVQSSPQKLPVSRLRSHSPWGVFDRWDTFAYYPSANFRLTAIDVQPMGANAYIKSAWELLVLMPGGYDVLAYRGFIDLGLDRTIVDEPDFYSTQAVGARAAIQLDGSTAVYPGNRLLVNLFQPADISGLPANDEITSARLDEAGILWLSTRGGIFKSKEPVAEIAP